MNRNTTGVAMASLSSGFGGLTAAQSDLVQHWQAVRRAGELPTRECLDPGEIKSHLSSISIVTLADGGRSRFRLAGSNLRQLFGREMRGRLLSELDRTTFEMWSLGLSRALEMGQPTGGLIQREEDSHAWLRLPLRSNKSEAMVLCHDALIPNARLKFGYDGQSPKITLSGRNLAA